MRFSSKSRQALIRVGGPLFIMTVLAAYSYLRLADRAAAAEAAVLDLSTCQRLAAEITRLRRLPRFAVLESESEKTTAERIEEARQLSQLGANAIARIEPQSPQRVGRSSYRVHATQVELENVTLAKATEFSSRLADEHHGLTVRDLRLIEPGTGGSRAERWRVEITLTQLIFSPTNR